MTNSDHTNNVQPEFKTIEELPEEEIEVPKWQVEHLKKQMIEEIKEEVEDDFKEWELISNPDSQIQSIIKEIYETLESGGGRDCFDAFYQNSEMDEYSRTDLVVDFIEEVMNRCDIDNSKVQEINQLDRDKLKTEEGMEEALNSIGEAVHEGSIQIKPVKEIIEDEYPELLAEQDGMSPEEYLAKQKEYAEQELVQRLMNMDSKEKFQEYFKEFREFNNNDIEDVAVRLNDVADLGVDVWYLVIAAMLSPNSRKINYNQTKIRSSMHLMFNGEISTAKSMGLGIVDDISPQSEKVTDMTEASFVGSYDASEGSIQEGIIDRVQGGNLIIEEYDKMSMDGSMMRDVFDNSSISITKSDQKKTIDPVNTSIMVAANPENDFFIEGENMRSQMPFKEGELSRFDIVIPLVNTKEQTNKIIDEIDVFGTEEEQLEMGEIRKVMEQMATKIQKVEDLEWEETEDGQPSLQRQMREAFKSLQMELRNQNRQELLIARDFEILTRIVNMVAMMEEPLENGEVTVTEPTLRKAISQFETIIDLRKRMYSSTKRQSLSKDQKDEILQELRQMTDGEKPVQQADLKDRCIDNDVVTNKGTFYNKMKELVNEERVKYADNKERYKEVVPLAQ